MERTEFEAILKIHLDPIKDTIARLEENQEQIVEILTNQARQDEQMKHIRQELERYQTDNDNIYERLRIIEDKIGDKIWDMFKLIAAAGISAIVSAIAVIKLR